jgi:hypothetical protein
MKVGGRLRKWLLTPILLTWTIWRAPTNASKWRMGFNSAFKGLNTVRKKTAYCNKKPGVSGRNRPYSLIQ